jgi:hypothetical protein
MKRVRNQGRQGDVLLTRVEGLPGICTELPPGDDRVVIAHGESTGHSHAMPAAAVRLLDHYGQMFIEVTGMEPQPLFHEEHEALLLEPGLYSIRIQGQYFAGTPDWRSGHGVD